MEGVLISVAVVACPVGMAVMGWFMMRGMRRDKAAQPQHGATEDLRAEHARLGDEIERLERDRQPAA